MNIERFLAKRIISDSANGSQLSRPIVRISVIGIALGLAVMILTISIVKGFQEEVRAKLIGVGAHILITNYDNNSSDEPLPISNKQPFLEQLRHDPTVAHFNVFTTKTGIIKTKTVNEGVVLKGVGADYDWTFISNNLKEGRPFTVGDTGASRSIIVSRYLADKLELKLNDKVIIYFLAKRSNEHSTYHDQRVKTFFICGIYETGLEDVDKTLVLVDIQQLQKLNYWTPEQVGGFELTIHNYNQIDETGERINELIGAGLIAQTIKEMNPTIFSWLDLQDVNAVIVIALMVLVAGINMISALLILILERTNMIGILKALGATNKSIQKVFLYNAGYLIGKGLIWGNIIGISIALIQKYYGLFKLDEATYYVSTIPIQFNLVYILLLNVGTLLCCLLMLILPSFIVSKITPVKAIRFS